MLVERLRHQLLEALGGHVDHAGERRAAARWPTVRGPTIGRVEAEALLDGLDDEQAPAVTCTAQPLVVLAPAGSGKTRVLTRRIAYRVATGAADARHVLALTFTRKAAGELAERLRRLGLRGDSTAGTFHAVAWAVLRTRWPDQRRQPPTLLDRKGRVLAELAPGPGRPMRSVAADLANEIEWAKARMVTPDTYVEAVGRRRPSPAAATRAAWPRPMPPTSSASSAAGWSTSTTSSPSAPAPSRTTRRSRPPSAGASGTSSSTSSRTSTRSSSASSRPGEATATT